MCFTKGLHDPPVGQRDLAPHLLSGEEKPYDFPVVTQKVRSKG